jgi:hypothetical protein
MTRILAVAAALLTLAACGGPIDSAGSPTFAVTPPADATAVAVVDGMMIYAEPGAPQIDNLNGWVAGSLPYARTYWGAPANLTEGARLYFLASAAPLTDGGSETDTTARVILLAADAGCPVRALAHAIGHLAIRDPGHTDPRWATLPTLGCYR